MPNEKLENLRNENLSKFQGTTLEPDGPGCRQAYLYYLQVRNASTNCNRPTYNCLTLGYNIFTHSVAGTNPSQGLYKGIESCSAHSVTLYSLNFNNWLTARSRMSLPLSRKQATCRKNSCKNIPRTNEHLRTAAHRYTREKPYMEMKCVRPLPM